MYKLTLLLFNRVLVMIHKIFVKIRDKAYRCSGYGYGLLEAVFWPHIDRWYRYSSVADEIRSLNSEASVLDVGCGGERVRYTAMILQSRPIPLLTGLVYLLSLKRYDNKPPYYACDVIYTKNEFPSEESPKE
jgi:hypothetical protein